MTWIKHYSETLKDREDRQYYGPEVQLILGHWTKPPISTYVTAYIGDGVYGIDGTIYVNYCHYEVARRIRALPEGFNPPLNPVHALDSLFNDYPEFGGGLRKKP